jgi:hypothetical protein
MSEGNRCEICKETVRGEKSKRKQTKYCDACARAKKKENTLCPWPPEKKREYMRRYMRAYRRSHPGLSSPYVRKYRQKKLEKLAAANSIGRYPLLRAPNDQGATRFLSLACFLPLLWVVSPLPETVDLSFETIKTVITYLELLVIKIAGLAIIIILCWRHLAEFLRRKKG